MKEIGEDALVVPEDNKEEEDKNAVEEQKERSLLMRGGECIDDLPKLDGEGRRKEKKIRTKAMTEWT